MIVISRTSHFRIIHKILNLQSGIQLFKQLSKKSAFNVSENFEFTRQRIGKYKVLANICESTVHVYKGGV